MGDTKGGARPSDQALAVPVEPASGLAPSGFDPSRFRPNSYDGKPRHLGKAERRELEHLVKAVRQHVAGLTDWRVNKLLKAFLDVSPINCSWQHFGLADLFVWEVAAIATEARRAETVQHGSVHEGANPKGIAR